MPLKLGKNFTSLALIGVPVGSGANLETLLTVQPDITEQIKRLMAKKEKHSINFI